MKALNRIRIMLFALMVFGAFANFAQNEWGNTVITICQGLIALTFIWESFALLIKRIKAKQHNMFNVLVITVIVSMFLSYLVGLIILHQNLNYFILANGIALLFLFIILAVNEVVMFVQKKSGLMPITGVYESFFLGMFFCGLMSKNFLLPGSNVVIFLSMAALILYFTIVMFRFFISNYKKGLAIISILSIGTTATILMGAAYLFKVMHWPGANIMFYVVLVFTAIMMLATIKWKYEFENKKINVLKAMQMLNKNILLFYFVSLTFGVYYQLASVGIAPKFYSQRLPSEVNKYIDEREDEKAEELRNAYVNFIERAEKNGFLK